MVRISPDQRCYHDQTTDTGTARPASISSADFIGYLFCRLSSPPQASQASRRLVEVFEVVRYATCVSKPVSHGPSASSSRDVRIGLVQEQSKMKAVPGASVLPYPFQTVLRRYPLPLLVLPDELLGLFNELMRNRSASRAGYV